MVVDLAIVISAVSVILAAAFGIASYKRNTRSDAKVDATQLTTVIVKLDLMSDSLKNLERDMRENKSETARLHERIAMLERSFSMAHPDLIRPVDGKR